MRALITAAAAVAWLAGVVAGAQTLGAPEEFTAVAVANNNIVTGVDTVLIDVQRWSTEAEREKLVSVLRDKGPRALLDALQDVPTKGRIRTPDSLGYDLRYAQQAPTAEGGRRIVVVTDRPIGFWEATNRPRSYDYPFTVVQMEIDKNGRGKGTLSLATKILAHGNTIELENFATAPVMLTEVRSDRAAE
jgi:hypothetical protein